MGQKEDDQLAKFHKAARETGTNESEEHFKARLRKIAKAQVSGDSLREPQDKPKKPKPGRQAGLFVGSFRREMIDVLSQRIAQLNDCIVIVRHGACQNFFAIQTETLPPRGVRLLPRLSTCR